MALVESWYFITAFYLGIALLVFYHRDKLDFEAKFIALYKTSIGIDAMKALVDSRIEKDVERGGQLLRYAAFPVFFLGSLWGLSVLLQRFDRSLPYLATNTLSLSFFAVFLVYVAILIWYRPIEEAGRHGIVLGYLGMIAIVAMLGQGLFNMLFEPEAAPVIAPIIPGVNIPGSPVTPPLVAGILSLFVVIVIHEFSHGVVSKAHGVPIESSGLLLFGPIPGAFVEPNEEDLDDKSHGVQNAVFGAGPYSNILSGLVFLIFFAFLLQPTVTSYLNPDGITVTSVENGTPAAATNLSTGITYTHVNGERVSSTGDFLEAVKGVKPNQSVIFTSDELKHTVIAGEHPQGKEVGYLGISIETTYERADTLLGDILDWIRTLFRWIVILSFGLGLANLLPIGPVDGGRMFHLAAVSWLGEERGENLWTKTTILVLSIVLVLLLHSIVYKGILQGILGL